MASSPSWMAWPRVLTRNSAVAPTNRRMATAPARIVSMVARAREKKSAGRMVEGGSPPDRRRPERRVLLGLHLVQLHHAVEARTAVEVADPAEVALGHGEEHRARGRGRHRGRGPTGHVRA